MKPARIEELEDLQSDLALCAVRYSYDNSTLGDLSASAVAYAKALASRRPACGHSACRQHWIDTGAMACRIDGGR